MHPVAQPAATSRSQAADDDSDDDEEDSDDDDSEEVGAQMQPVAQPSAAPTTVLLSSPFIENIDRFPPKVVTSPILGPTKASAQAEEALIQHGTRGYSAYIVRSRADACHGRTGGLAAAALKDRKNVLPHSVWCPFERLRHSLGLGRVPNIETETVFTKP
jgi:hypothetical protein